MQLTILFFARARELAGTGTLTLELPEGSTVQVLRSLLAARLPALAPLLERSALAVNEAFANNEQKLGNSAVVAVIPPVSGG
jgi:molybdopterin converting factor subunit 1